MEQLEIIKTTKTTLVKINPKDYGLTESKAQEIEAMFAPMLAKMVELEKDYNEISALKINQETCLKARNLRLQYVKVRTGTANIHKELKAFYLNGGRFVDGWKNAQLFASQGIEEKLSAIENHFEIMEKERIAGLQTERSAEMAKYQSDFIPSNLGEMPDEVWQNFLLGTKTNYEARKAAELKAERDRLAKERAEAEEREQIRKDNVRLQQEAEERETKRIEAEKKQQEQAEKERLQHEAELKRVRDENDRIAKQLEAKRIEAEKTESERLALIESEKSKDDSAKVHDLIDELNSVKVKFEFKSAKNKKMYSDVGLLIDKIITHIRQ